MRLARTNEDLTRHGDASPTMAAAHRAAGKRRRCRDLVAAVAPMVARPCSPSSRAHPLRVANRTPRTPTPSRSSPAATRNRFSSRLTAFLMHGAPSLAAPWRTAGSCGSGKHGDASPSIAGSRSLIGIERVGRDPRQAVLASANRHSNHLQDRGGTNRFEQVLAPRADARVAARRRWHARSLARSRPLRAACRLPR